MEKELSPCRVWLYARIPGDYVGTMDSIKVCALQAHADGCTVVGSSTDEHGGWLLRPGYREMLRHIRKGEIDTVYICRMRHISRSEGHLISFFRQLKPVAMLSMLEYINTAVMSNERNDPKAATWVYFDEIYLLLRDSLSANFLYTSWKRFRKYNAYATGITQNVQDCLTNDTAYAMLANSEFVVMLRQTKDIDSVVELYGLSEPQRKYLLLAQPGEGIIKMGNSLIPFNNPQPKDTKTYKLLTTKPGEME